MSHSNYYSNGARDGDYKNGERYGGQAAARRPNGTSQANYSARRGVEGSQNGAHSRTAHDSPEDWQDIGASKNSVRHSLITAI